MKHYKESMGLFNLVERCFLSGVPLRIFKAKSQMRLWGGSHSTARFPNFNAVLDIPNLADVRTRDEPLHFEILTKDEAHILNNMDSFKDTELYNVLEHLIDIGVSEVYVQSARKSGVKYVVKNFVVNKTDDKYTFKEISSNNSVSVNNFLGAYNYKDMEMGGHIMVLGYINQIPLAVTKSINRVSPTPTSFANGIRHPRVVDRSYPTIDLLNMVGYNLIESGLVQFTKEYLSSVGTYQGSLSGTQRAKGYIVGHPRYILNTNSNISFGRIPLSEYEDRSNIKQPSGYNSVVYKNNGLLCLASKNQVTPSNRTASFYEDVHMFYKGGPHETNTRLRILSEEVSEETILDNLNEMSSTQLSIIKNKWDNIHARLQNKISEFELSKLAISFIIKYLFPSMGETRSLIGDVGNWHTDITPDNQVPIEKAFNKEYGDYEGFFGVPSLSTLYNQYQGIPTNIYQYDNGRITSNKYSPQSRYFDDLKTNTYFGNDLKKMVHRGQHYHNKDSITIINDSDTKKAWLKKTRIFIREYLRKNGPTDIYLVEANTSLEIAVLKNIVSNNPHFISYSSFEESITIPKASAGAAPIKRDITIYSNPDNMFKHKLKLTLDLDDTSDYLFMEYQVSSNKIIIESNPIPMCQFIESKLYNFILKATGKRLAFVSQANLKKLKQYDKTRNTTITLYEYAMDKNRIKDAQDSISKFTLIDNPSFRVYREISHSILYDRVASLSRLRDKRGRGLIKFWYLILNELPEDLREVYSLISGQAMTKEYPNGETDVIPIDDNIIVIPDQTEIPGSLYNILDSMMPTENFFDISPMLKRISKAGYTSRIKSRLDDPFQIRSLYDEYIKLLTYSNNLNLDIAVHKDLENKMLITFLTKAKIILDIINKDYPSKLTT